MKLKQINRNNGPPVIVAVKLTKPVNPQYELQHPSIVVWLIYKQKTKRRRNKTMDPQRSRTLCHRGTDRYWSCNVVVLTHTYRLIRSIGKTYQRGVVFSAMPQTPRVRQIREKKAPLTTMSRSGYWYSRYFYTEYIETYRFFNVDTTQTPPERTPLPHN